jgi:hypothetical protein
MSKTVAILLTLLAVVLCACPGLITLFSFFYSLTVSTPTQSMIDAGIIPPTGAWFDWAVRIALLLITLVGILIPIIVGLVTLRRKKTQSI